MSDLINTLKEYKVNLENIVNSSNSFLNIPVYVINLNTDKFRRAYIQQILKKMNIDYKLIVVEKITDEIRIKMNSKLRSGIVGCCLSHLWCIQHAIDSNYNHFLILEDDVIFHKQFQTLFKEVDYHDYDMIQLGCCDFNLHENLSKSNVSTETNNATNQLTIYRPTKIALGAYGNIYNIAFAKLILQEKTHYFTEFDMKFDTYYDRYKMGICYPNLITCELSTSNLEHDYSMFTKFRTSYKNDQFVKKCFTKFHYSDYYFIWIVFLEFCYEEYQNENVLKNYTQLTEQFSYNYPRIKDDIINTLANNDYTIDDLNEIMVLLKNDKYS